MKRFIKKEGGFTLIELLVVILIIGILIAVAAPSFLGQTEKAQASAQQQDLSVAYRALKAAAVTETNQGSFSGIDVAAALTASEGTGFLAQFSDEAVNGADEVVVLTHTVKGAVECVGTFTGLGATGGPQYSAAVGKKC